MAENPLTNQYGALKGWQWAALTGSLLAVYLYVHKRQQDAAAAASSTDTTAGTGDASGYAPNQILAPIIIQQGPGSTPVLGKPVPPIRPKPTPKKQPAPAQKVNAGNYPKTVAANSTLGAAMLKGAQVGTIKNGRYVGKNSSSGAPVYALIDTGFGPRTSLVQGFNIAKLPNGTKIYTLPQFKALFK